MNLNLDNFGNILSNIVGNRLSRLIKKYKTFPLKKVALILILQFVALPVYALEYSGFIGNSPVHFSIESIKYPDNAVYMYDQHHQPIFLILGVNNQNKEVLKFDEYVNSNHLTKRPSAKITLHLDSNHPEQLMGEWQSVQTKVILPIHLLKYDEPAGLLQSSSFKKAYIRKQCTQDQDDKTVRIYDKKTNQLLETIQTGGECRGDEVQVDDYNFDGYEDFSVYSEGFAGANSKNNYFLYNPRTYHYEYSGELTDVSLYFDPKHKIVISKNECCAGRQTLIQRYIWKRKKLEKLDSSCLIYDDKSDRLVKHPGKFCE